MKADRDETERTPAPPPAQPRVPVAEFMKKPGQETEDERLLAREPEAEPIVETTSDAWRVFRIMGEFVEGFDTLARHRPGVTIFGSARTQRDDPHYHAAEVTARLLAKEGFVVITGGGPGIMEAANKGATEAGGESIGCNIELPFEQGMNEYVQVPINFRYFFVRKTMFVKYAEAFIIFPGGFGTMDELFESLTLIQTGKVRDFPVILFGSVYWRGLLDWLRGTMLAEDKIRAADLDLLTVTDDPEEAVQTVIECYERQWARAAERSAGSHAAGAARGLAGRGGLRPATAPRRRSVG